MSVIEDGWTLGELVDCFRYDFRDEAESYGVPMPERMRLHIFDWGDADGGFEAHVIVPSSMRMVGLMSGSDEEAVVELMRDKVLGSEGLPADEDITVPLDELESLLLGADEELLDSRVRFEIPSYSAPAITWPAYVCDFDFRPLDGYVAIGLSIPDAEELFL